MRLTKLKRIAVAGLLAGPAYACATAPSGVVAIRSDSSIEFAAVVSADAFQAGGEIAGYHFIVWDGGGSADHALLLAQVSDVQVLDALESLGAQPGNGLQIDSWDDRHDPNAEAPRQVIAGPSVVIEVLVPGRNDALGLEEILVDPGERGFDMRFGGHRDNIGQWHSGCVVCLYSCPGSKVGNASYTVADFVQGATHFEVRPGVLPADGTEVTVRISLVSRADSAMGLVTPPRVQEEKE